MSATVAILWLLFPIEIKVVTAGARRVCLNSSKPFAFEVEPPACQKVQSEEFSLSTC
jgi:hypothetical protein